MEAASIEIEASAASLQRTHDGVQRSIEIRENAAEKLQSQGALSSSIPPAAEADHEEASSNVTKGNDPSRRFAAHVRKAL